MNNLEKENEAWPRRNAAEGRETSFESKEKRDEELEKKLAAKERAEQMAHEVKTTKKQMQNITANMQQVLKAVRAIRDQLGLLQSGQVPSVARDEEALANLKKRLARLNSELGDLKMALVEEYVDEVHKENPEWDENMVKNKAEKLADLTIKKISE